MALLGLAELMLAFALICAMLAAPVTLDHLSFADLPISPASIDRAAELALTIVLVAAGLGLYQPDVCLDRRRLLANAAVAGLLAFPAVLLVDSGFRPTGDHTLWLIRMLAVWLVLMLGLRLTVGRVLRHGLARRILIVAPAETAAVLHRSLSRGRGRLFEPVALGRDTSMLSCDALRRQRIWGVVVATPAPLGPFAAALVDSKLRGVRVFSPAVFAERQLGRIDCDSLDASWLLQAEGFAPGAAYRVLKRGGDLVICSLLLLLTLPLMLLAAVAIRLDSSGPVLYRQVRTGRFGRPFTLFKFRSMRTDAEAGGTPRWAQHQDPRVTRVGGFIRTTRIDELPQLFNVLRGDMSLVGPRPERPHFVAELDRAIPFYRHRHCVAPGITGWAQVNFPYGASIEDSREKLAYDLYYVKNRNLLLDLLILFATVRVILFREGAR
jgi:sugar transferase (PEP-CTERM system associated)